MTTTTNITADQAVELLVSEGYARADVLSTIDSLIEAGVEDDQNRLTDADVQVCRDQLDADDVRVREVERVADALGVSTAVLVHAAEESRAGRFTAPLDQATIDLIERGRSH
ncbi:MAG: hypothetical protein M0Z51_05170 [Propionibacterium sp.]|nr:hypothetical protein [Propionibacterium sp.]